MSSFHLELRLDGKVFLEACITSVGIKRRFREQLCTLLGTKKVKKYRFCLRVEDPQKYFRRSESRRTPKNCSSHSLAIAPRQSFCFPSNIKSIFEFNCIVIISTIPQNSTEYSFFLFEAATGTVLQNVCITN